MTARDRLVIVIVLAAAAVVGSGMLVIQPRRDKAAKLGAQISSVQSQLSSARAQLADAQTARAAFATAYSELTRLGEAVPADDNVPSLIYELQSAAGAARVDFRSLQLSGSGTSAAPAPSTPGAAINPASLPPGATVGPAGLPVEQFSFTFRGSFFQLADFFNRLQRLVVANNTTLAVSGRLLSLNSISLQQSPGGFPQIAATVSATAYLVPSSEGLLAGATPAGPAPVAPASASSAAPVSSAPSSASSHPAAVVTPPVR